jgi:uncharacterized protein (TIGR02466 family)
MIEQWFPTLILCDFLDGYTNENKNLKNIAYEIRKKFPDSNSHWSCNTYHTSNVIDIKKEKYAQSLMKDISSKVFELSYAYGLNNKNIICTDAWFNISEHGNYQEFHIHPMNHFSVVYYISAPENCGDIVFKKNDDMFPFPTSSLPTGSTNCYFKPEESKILVFPSSLHHMVRENKSNQDRISMSFNFLLN